MGDTTIEWTNKTWNPTRGCSLVSPGCTNCYAMGQAHRFSGSGKPFAGFTRARLSLGPVWTGEVRLAIDMLRLPLTWRKPQRVFVNSMSDLFHEELTNEEIAAVFAVMAASQRHTFQVLTKRARRMREWFEWAALVGEAWRPRYRNETHGVLVNERLNAFALKYVDMPTDFAREWPLPNVWIGVSAEDQERADERVPELLRTPAATRFVSYEPALGPIAFCDEWLHGVFDHCPDETNDPETDNCAGCTAYPNDGGDGGDVCSAIYSSHLDWIIVGGESGPRARPFDVAWARSVVAQCKAAGVACFVKQLGRRPIFSSNDTEYWANPAASAKHANPLVWPKDLRVREFPKVVLPS